MYLEIQQNIDISVCILHLFTSWRVQKGVQFLFTLERLDGSTSFPVWTSQWFTGYTNHIEPLKTHDLFRNLFWRISRYPLLVIAPFRLCFSSIRVCLNLENMNAGKSYDSVDLVWNSGGYSLQVPLFPCKKLRRNFRNAFFLGFWPNTSTLKVNKSFLARKLVLTLTKCFFSPVGSWEIDHPMSFHLKKDFQLSFRTCLQCKRRWRQTQTSRRGKAYLVTLTDNIQMSKTR